MTAAQIAWYLRHIPLRDEVVVDVGANVGAISQAFWDASARTSRVISVEPIPENVKAIEARIRASKATSKWSVKRCAISSRDGHLPLRPIAAPWGTNSVVGAHERSIEIACRTLEGLVPDATVVKVDVEGHEWAFLPQAITALDRVKVWALELHAVDDHPLEGLLGLLADRGFELLSAGHRRDRPEVWIDLPIDRSWTWERVPGVASIRDGMPSAFKMIHVLAKRRDAPERLRESG
jgi:FkbM family methyltransferase